MGPASVGRTGFGCLACSCLREQVSVAPSSELHSVNNSLISEEGILKSLL